MEMMGGKDIDKDCRLPEIMSDAAYAMFLRDPKSFTGHFAIDEGILREEGVTNFDEYAVDPSITPMLDFFLDEETILEAEGKTALAGGAAPAAAEAPPSAAAAAAPAATKGSVGDIFTSLQAMINGDIVQKINGFYVFHLKGKEAGTWFLDLKNGPGAVGQGDGGNDKPDVVMTMTSDNFAKMFSGKLKPSSAFMTGKLKIKGDMTMAIKLEKLMKKMNQ